MPRSAWSAELLAHLSAPGVTRAAVARVLGVTPQYVGALASGQRSPSPRVVRLCAERLGLVTPAQNETRDGTCFGHRRRVQLTRIETTAGHDLAHALDTLARAIGRSRADVVRELLVEGLERRAASEASP